MDKCINDLVQEGLKALAAQRELEKEAQAREDAKNKDAWVHLYWDINDFVPPELAGYMAPLVEDFSKPYNEDVETLLWNITFNVQGLAPIRMRMVKVGKDWCSDGFKENNICADSPAKRFDRLSDRRTSDILIGTPWIHRETRAVYWRYDLDEYNSYFGLNELHLALGTAKERYDEYLELVRQAEYQAYELEYVPVEETQAPVDGFMTELKALIKTVAKDVVEG